MPRLESIPLKTYTRIFLLFFLVFFFISAVLFWTVFESLIPVLADAENRKAKSSRAKYACHGKLLLLLLFWLIPLPS